MEEGEGGDRMEHLHRNEAISAVADEGFLGEEDDDYEDLYNDVNVGEGFLQSLRKNEDLVIRNEETKDSANWNDNAVSDNNNIGGKVGGSPMSAPEPRVSNLGVADGVKREDSRVSYESQGFSGGAHNNVKGPSVGTGGGGSGLRVELAQASSKLNDESVEQNRNNNNNSIVGVGSMGQQRHGVRNVGSVENEGLMRQGVGGGNVNVNVNGGGGPMIGNGVGNVGVASAVPGSAPGVGASGGGTILFVGDLHWWTTDAELESELCKYGPVKEVKFFDEKASGKSKGYCQVEFYDPAAATACKTGMNGHVFNGRPCVVAFASPFTVKKMGEAQLNRNQQMAQSTLSQAGRGRNDAGGKPVGNSIQTGGNYQGGDNNNRGYGRGNIGRGNAQGIGNRGPVGPMRNRAGGMGGRGIMGNGGNGFGQGIGAAPPLMHPQSMMGQGFGPAFGGAMGRMGSYGGFPGALMPPFSGMLNSFPPVGGVGLPGVAPHVNPAFFGRGMHMNGMGIVPSSGVDGPNMGWSDPGMGGWGGDEHGGGRAGESSYGEEAAFDHQHGEGSHDRGGWQNPTKEKDRASEKEWSGSSERRCRDEREPGYDRDTPVEKDTGHGPDRTERGHQDDRDISRERDRERDRDRERSRDRDRNRERECDRERDRDRYREDKDRYADHHRYKDRESEHDNDWDRGRSSRTNSKSRLSQEEEHRSRSRDADYGKRRRLTSD